MESATITKVTHSKRKPPQRQTVAISRPYCLLIMDPHKKMSSRREFLGLYLIGNPSDKFELDYNEEIMLKARGIRATPRELAIINEEFGFRPHQETGRTFLEYFESKDQREISEMEIVYKHS